MHSNLTLLLILAAAPGVASATCPLTRWNVYSETVETAEPVGSVTRYCYEYQCYANTSVTWNAPLGAVSVFGDGGGSHGGCSGSSQTTDDFELVGAPAGASVNVTAALAVAGTTYADEWQSTSAWHGLSDGTGRTGTPDPGGARRLLLSLTFVPGVAQRLTYFVAGSSWRMGVSGSAVLSFPDLPAGMSIVSCRGFTAGQITATRPVSWGKLKQVYR